MNRFTTPSAAFFILLQACVTSSPDFVARDRESNIVTIGAGRALVNADASQYWRLWYIIDANTRTCWFKIGDSVGALDCCRLWNHPKAFRYVRRLGLSCNQVPPPAPVLPPQPPAPPTSQAQPPATPPAAAPVPAAVTQ